VLAGLLALAPALRLDYPHLKPEPRLDDPRAEQQRLFENLTICLAALSSHAPLLLILEDVHWADSGTLLLMLHLEAIGYYRQALELLHRAGDLEQVARALMKLGLTYHNAFDFRAARQTYQEGFVFWQRTADEKRDAFHSPPPAPHALRVTAFEPRSLGLGLSMDFPSHVVLDQLFSGLM
jgi:tetratricopeptide (TPR) repeat protein